MKPIDEVYILIAAHPEDGAEEIMGYAPLVERDQSGVERLVEMAKEMADDLGLPVTLVRFHHRTNVQVIPPTKK